MEWLILLPFFLLFLGIGLGGVVYELSEGRERKRRKCLENTARLERELFPEWFQEEKTRAHELSPQYYQVYSPVRVSLVTDEDARRHLV